MTRLPLRVAIALVAAAGVLATLTAPPAPATEVLATTVAPTTILTPQGKRPNVVMVMMDDMRADELRWMPNVREYITGRGLEFRNAFSPYPLCCPARASLLLGKYAHNHRVLHHDSPFGFGSFDDRLTLATRLHAAGYKTGFVGKYLNGYGRQRSRVTGGSSVRYVPRGWTDWRASLDDGWGGTTGNGTYSYWNMTQNVNGRVRRNDGVYSSRVIAEQGAGLVHKYAPTNTPFFILMNPVAPHFGGPREPDDPTPTRTSNGILVKYPTPARPGWVKGRFNAHIAWGLGVRADGGPSEADVRDKPRNIRFLPEATAGEKRRMRDIARQRAESIFAWDYEFGRVVAALKRTRELSETVLVFTSDNGYYNGEHRQRTGKIKAHDPVLRVPLVIAGPRIPHGVRYAPVTTVDLTTTILEIARAGRPADMDGMTRLPELVVGDRPWTTPVVTEGRLPGLARNVPFPAGLHTSGLRTGRYQLIMYSTGEGELYDLLADPNQLTSLYRSAAHRNLRDRLVRLWRQYHSCSARQCRVPLPTDLHVTPASLHQQELRRTAVYRSYYR